MDSNVIVDFVALSLPKAGSDFVENLFNIDFLISIIVKIEVLGYSDAPNKMAALEDFISDATIFPLDDAVTQKTIELRRLHKKLKLGDAIIAATAICHNLTLISRNVSDFKNIAELTVIDVHLI